MELIVSWIDVSLLIVTSVILFDAETQDNESNMHNTAKMIKTCVFHTFHLLFYIFVNYIL